MYCSARNPPDLSRSLRASGQPHHLAGAGLPRMKDSSFNQPSASLTPFERNELYRLQLCQCLELLDRQIAGEHLLGGMIALKLEA